MAWYYGNHSCGCEGRTNVIGPSKNREWISENHFSKICSECWEKKAVEEREIANAVAEEKAKEMELPELQGTPKQVAWANTLRQSMIDFCGKRVESFEGRNTGGKMDSRILQFNEVLNHVLITKTNASWYIDTRSELPEDLFVEVIKEMNVIEETKRPEVKEAIKEQKELKETSTVYPENCGYKVAAEIKIVENKIQVSFEKNEKFRDLVKDLRFEWGNGYWYRDIISKNGTAEDRAAELGNALLNAGFPITIIDSTIRQNAIDGKYESECTRWIETRVKGEFEGMFAIRWEDKNDKLYNSARSLPNSKWSSPNVVVRTEYYKEVQDFSTMFGFKFSKSALDAIEKQKEIEIIKTIVKPATKKEPEKKNGLMDILNSSTEILDDLKDGE